MRPASRQRPRMVHFELSRETAARAPTPRLDDRGLPDARPAARVRAMVPTHPTASQIADRRIPPRDGRGLLPAPTARTAADNTSIRPCDRALSIAGLPLPSRRNVLSLMALARLRLLRSASEPVSTAR